MEKMNVESRSSAFSVVGRFFGGHGALRSLSLCALALALGTVPAVASGQGCGQPVSCLTAFGFEQTAVGDAILETDCDTGRLKVSNLGSSGCDGVSINLGESVGVEYSILAPLMPSTTTDGSIMTATRSYGGNASATLVCEDIGNETEVRSEFLNLGVTSKTLRVYDDDPITQERVLVAEVRGHTGSWDFRLGDATNPAPVVSSWGGGGGGGGGTLECRGRLYCGGEECRLITINGGGSVMGTGFEVLTESYVNPMSSSTFTILAGAGIQELNIVSEALVQFPGLAHTVVHDAVFEPPTGSSKLKISNLGSSGCDGVSINLGGTDSFEVEVAELNDGNGIPDGAFTETLVRGTVAGVRDQLITTSRITDAGNQLELSVSGAASYTVRLFSGGNMIFEEGGRGGGPIVRVSESNPCKREIHFVLPNLDPGGGFPFAGAETYRTTWEWDSLASMDIPGGASFQADELHVIPEGNAAPDFLTGFEMRGADVGSIEIGDEKSFLCRGGTVNWEFIGQAEDVLRVNGSVGVPGTREVSVPVRDPITVSLSAAPEGPALAKYFLVAWIGDPQAPTNLRIAGNILGCFVNPIPLTGGNPMPFRCLRGGLPSVVCNGVREINAPPTAPFEATKATGLANPLTLSIQAFLEDNGSAHPVGYSVTNAVIVNIQ